MKSEGHHGGDSDGAGGAAPAAPFRSSLRGVVSGSQTGADRAALRAARAAGLATAGVAPRGFNTEAGRLGQFVLIDHRETRGRK